MFRYFLKNNRKFSSAIKNLITAALPIVCLTVAGAVQAQQNPGSLDPSFNGNGKIVANLGNPDNVAGEIAVQPDGKIVVAGLTGTIDTMGKTPGSSDFVVLRYNADGTIDNTFDGDGKVVTSFGDGEDGAGAVLIQPDGKILIAGSINNRTPAGEIALARYNADGSLDAAFDGDGKVTTDAQQNVEERAEAMVLQPDGKIVVVVSTVRPDFLENQVYVVRYNANGSLDSSFAGDGITTLPFAIPGGVAQGLTGNGIAVQPDGKIVVAGTVLTAQTGDFFVWRINPDGTDDQTFGGRVVTISFNNSDNAVSIFLQPAGKIFVAGASVNNTTFRNDFAFARLNPTGALDATFDGDGKKTTSYNDAAFTIPLEFEMLPNGKIISVGGAITPAAPTDANFAVTRFDASGNLDSTFDGDGKVVTSFGSAGDAAFAAAAQPDGKILAAGSTETGTETDDYNIAVARYIGDATAAPRDTEFDFDGDGKSDVSVFRPTSGTWFVQPSGASNPNSSYGVQWGISTDRVTPADFDGDGKSDVAVWRGSDANNPGKSFFYILNSSNNTVRIEQFGAPDDLPFLAGDWDGDGKADPAVYRGGTTAAPQSFFFYRPSGSPGVDFRTVYWGTAGDKPVRGDFDGDGKLDAAVFRSSDNVWYILQSSNNQPRYAHWGLNTDRFVPADYDGDGKTDLAVFRSGVWYIRQSSDNQPRYVAWGLETDALVPADYDGDGKTDVAVNRNGVWYLLESTSGQMRVTQFGAPNDAPLPAADLFD